MIRLLTTPNHADGFYRELVSRDSPRFQKLSPIKRGTPYSICEGGDERVNAAFPNLLFCSEQVPIGSNTVAGMQQREYVIWNWSSNPLADSTYNAEVTYLGESITNPVYARTYGIPRDEYEANPVLPVGAGTPLTALLGVRKINGGNGYTKASATLLGPGADTAKVEWVIGDNGEIVSGIVVEEGEGFDSTSSIQVIGDGVHAEYELILQPPEAVLTSQRKVELGDGDPLQPEFVKVLRVWEVLPGPWLPFTRYDENLGPIQGRQRAVLNTGQKGGIVQPTRYLNYQAREGSSIVSMEREERFSDGTGSDPDNPTYPILAWSTYSDERGRVDHTSQLFANEFAGHQATLVHNGTTAIRTWFEPYQDNPANLVHKLTETWTEPTPLDGKIISEFGGGRIAISEATKEPGTQNLEAGLLIVSSELQSKNPNQQTLRTAFLGDNYAWPILQGAHTDEKTGIVLKFSKQVIDAYTPIPVRNGYRGPFIEDQPYDRWKTIRITTAPDPDTLPGQEEWFTSRPFNLPSRLISIEAFWRDAVSKSASVQRGQTQNSMSSSIHSGCSGDILVTAQSGYRGNARTRVVRNFFIGPVPPFPVDTFKIKAANGSVVLFTSDYSLFSSGTDDETPASQGLGQYSVFTDGGTLGDTFRQQVNAINIGDHLVGPDVSIVTPTHQAQFVTATSNSPAGKFRTVTFTGSAPATFGLMQVNLPYSVPTPGYLNAMTEILWEVELEEWGYGIWVSYRYYVQMAGLVF